MLVPHVLLRVNCGMLQGCGVTGSLRPFSLRKHIKTLIKKHRETRKLFICDHRTFTPSGGPVLGAGGPGGGHTSHMTRAHEVALKQIERKSSDSLRESICQNTASWAQTVVQS